MKIACTTQCGLPRRLEGALQMQFKEACIEYSNCTTPHLQERDHKKASACQKMNWPSEHFTRYAHCTVHTPYELGGSRWGGCLYIQIIAYKSNPKCTFLAQAFPLLHVLYETAAAEKIARQCWSPNRPFSASKLAQIFFGHLFTSFHGLNHSELFSSFPLA